ncbi:AAA family ATPase [Zavarzinia sp.]|uniref:AAA family ATPase n=1 Tax=Zavarzinia sp. TaxID=2027920 RepID=UPI003569A803
MQLMWLVAGPNGSGKSTVARSHLIPPPGLEHINADDIAAEMRRDAPTEPEDKRSLRAAREADARVDACIRDERSFMVETVLSSGKYWPRVTLAKAKGFLFVLTYVVLRDPQLSIERVSQRVAGGGHDVPSDRIVSRWHKSVYSLRRFAEQADAGHIFDNSTVGRPTLIAQRFDEGWRQLAPCRIPEIEEAMAGLWIPLRP